ncbi:MAG: exonuclease domain-containing protein [Bryobacteraceae bacterium]
MPENNETTNLAYAAIVDVETTGFSHEYDEVVELAIVLFSFDRATGEFVEIVDQYQGLRDPGRSIPPEATNVHGLRYEDVQGQRLDEGKVREILSRAELLISHNERFDRGFLKRLFREADCKRWRCSMNGINWRRKGYPSKGLQELLAVHQIPVDTAHRALADVRSTLALLNYVQPSGRTYLAELLQL